MIPAGIKEDKKQTFGRLSHDDDDDDILLNFFLKRKAFKAQLHTPNQPLFQCGNHYGQKLNAISKSS